MRKLDLTGQRFNRLVALERAGKRGRAPLYKCHCDCGSITIARGWDLKTGNTTSCGCWRNEQHTTHGHSTNGQSREYAIWHAMRQRCSNKKCTGYKNYGARGITVCDRWLSFENFIADMGLRPGPHYSLDRIDNSKGYSPENCRWATKREQVNNTRVNRRVTIKGRTLTATEWAREVGISPYVFRSRLNIGWHPERALYSPVVSRPTGRRGGSGRSTV